MESKALKLKLAEWSKAAAEGTKVVDDLETEIKRLGKQKDGLDTQINTLQMDLKSYTIKVSEQRAHFEANLKLEREQIAKERLEVSRLSSLIEQNKLETDALLNRARVAEKAAEEKLLRAEAAEKEVTQKLSKLNNAIQLVK